MNSKTPSESRTVMTDMVLPSETNPLNNLFDSIVGQHCSGYMIFQEKKYLLCRYSR